MTRKELIIKEITKHLADKNLVTSDAIQKLVAVLSTPDFDDLSIPYSLFCMSRSDQNVRITYDGFKHIYSEKDEGNNEHAEGIWQLDDYYYRFVYAYYSYSDFDYYYGTLYVVQPKEKVVTVYEAV